MYFTRSCPAHNYAFLSPDEAAAAAQAQLQQLNADLQAEIYAQTQRIKQAQATRELLASQLSNLQRRATQLRTTVAEMREASATVLSECAQQRSACMRQIQHVRARAVECVAALQRANAEVGQIGELGELGELEEPEGVDRPEAQCKQERVQGSEHAGEPGRLEALEPARKAEKCGMQSGTAKASEITKLEGLEALEGQEELHARAGAAAVVTQEESAANKADSAKTETICAQKRAAAVSSTAEAAMAPHSGFDALCVSCESFAIEQGLGVLDGLLANEESEDCRRYTAVFVTALNQGAARRHIQEKKSRDQIEEQTELPTLQLAAMNRQLRRQNAALRRTERQLLALLDQRDNVLQAE